MHCNGSLKLDILPQELRRLLIKRKRSRRSFLGNFLGTLETSYLPHSREHVTVRYNKFKGTLDCTSFLQVLEICDISYNESFSHWGREAFASD